MTNLRTFRLLSAALVTLSLSATPLLAQGPASAAAPVTTGGWEAYVRVTPRFYSFDGDQGYLQRYRALDAENEDGLDTALATLSELAVQYSSPEPGAAKLELVHTNPFVLNDAWLARFRPEAGSRLELSWHEYQRPLEAFLPTPATNSITYARRYNDDRDPERELYRRRGDLAVTATFAPYVWTDSLRFFRRAEVGLDRRARTGNRHFSWIFGVVEDLVIPRGDSPERWRGRTEAIDQVVDRFAFDATLALAPGNTTRLQVFREEFDNQAPTVTNADIALVSPAVNTQARTIDFIADYSLEGVSFAMEQPMGGRVTVFIDGSKDTLTQTSESPLEAEAEYTGKIRTQSLSAGVSVEATDQLVIDAAAGWAKRKNETPVGTSTESPRTYLIQDRNLSGPFLKSLETKAWGGSLSWYGKKLSLRAGANHESSERDFVRGVGANAIVEGMVVWGARSNPKSLWASASGRVARQLRWSARYQYLTADDTWTVTEPTKSHQLKATASWAAKSGTFGVNGNLNWEDSRNDGFIFQNGSATAPQRMELDATSFGVSAWYGAGETVQVYAGYQRISRDQEGNLVLTDIRRWRPMVLPRIGDPAFGYDSTVTAWNLGAALTFGEKLVVVPSITYTDAEGGIVSAATPVRDYSNIANNALVMAVAADYRLSKRMQVNLQYAYGDYDDAVSRELSGKLQEFSVGVTVGF